MGGVATAARLAKAGFKVTVLEKNDFTGGRCSLIHHQGHVRAHSILTDLLLRLIPSDSIKALLFSYSHTYLPKHSRTSTPHWKPKESSS